MDIKKDDNPFTRKKLAKHVGQSPIPEAVTRLPRFLTDTHPVVQEEGMRAKRRVLEKHAATGALFADHPLVTALREVETTHGHLPAFQQGQALAKRLTPALELEKHLTNEDAPDVRRHAYALALAGEINDANAAPLIGELRKRFGSRPQA